jgi:16S rRNA (guanine527-N7)-methyltransferase
MWVPILSRSLRKSGDFGVTGPILTKPQPYSPSLNRDSRLRVPGWFRSHFARLRCTQFANLPQASTIPHRVDTARIADLLQPFLVSFRDEPIRRAASLTQPQLDSISTYIDLLLRWNARINLTAVRQPEKIVTRHFGESLFAARHLFPMTEGRVGHVGHVGTGVSARPAGQSPAVEADGELPRTNDVIDIGSGAGFPGIPIKLWAPGVRLTLIEANGKKVAFLREAARALTLTDINIFPARAEDFQGTADLGSVVTLRAVERFDSILPVAARLVAPSGRLALLIGQAQATRAREILPTLRWQEAIPIPLSSARMLLVGHKREPT